MNFRVDLILDSERRSGAPVSARGLLQIAAFAIPLTFVVLLSVWIVDAHRREGEAAMVRSEWERIRPMQQRAREIRQQLITNRATLELLKNIGFSRIQWHRQIEAVPRIVPENIQFLTLRADQTTGRDDNNNYIRKGKMDITGRAVGAGADAAVQALKHNFETMAPFSNTVASVTVLHFGQDQNPSARPGDREFTMQCVYSERKIK